jgi:hypothetical protein
VAVSEATGKPTEEVFFAALRAYPRNELNSSNLSLPLCLLHPIGLKFGVSFKVEDKKGNLIGMYGLKAARGEACFLVENGHISCVSKLSMLVITRGSIPLTISPKAQTLVNKLNAWPAIKWFPWVPEKKRAADLVREMRAGAIGILGSESINEEQLKRWDAMCDTDPPRLEKYMCCVMGDPGCRKSSPAQKMLLNRDVRDPNTFVAIMPVKTLQQDWRDKLDATGGKTGKKLMGDAVPTWERALAKDCSGFVAFTDENKFPKGFHALYHLLNPQVKYHVFLCDPWQSSWHSPTQTALNDPSIAGEAEFYMNNAIAYLVGTWRFKAPTADFFRMPSFCKQTCGWSFIDFMPNSLIDILPCFPKLSAASVSQLWQERVELFAAHFGVAWAEALRSSDAVSFAGSQGLSAGLTIIEVDQRVASYGSDPRLFYTAMTRSKFIIFVRTWRENGRTEYDVKKHPILSQLEYYRKKYKLGDEVIIEPEHTFDIREHTSAFPTSLKIMLSGPKNKLVNWDFVSRWWESYDFDTDFLDPDKVRVGARLSRDDPILEDQHVFQAFIDETEDPDPDDEPPDEATPNNARVTTAIPEDSRAMLIESHNSQVKEREEAELRVRGSFSEQFPDTYLLRKDHVRQMRNLVEEQPGRNKLQRNANARRLLAKLSDDKNPLLFKPDLYNWGARQRNDDSVTWLAARKQRIEYASKMSNELNYQGQKELGLACWNAFRMYMGWHQPVAWDQLYYEKCVYAFQVKRGERSAAVKKGSRNRADMEMDTITMTIKNQWKVKDRLFKAAKPGQPIMTHSDQYLFEHGPYGAYLLDKFLQHHPPWFYFHAKKTINDYEVWNAKWMQEDNISEMTDLEGQDGTTQGWAVVFFENLMRWFGLPENFVLEWVRNKKSKEVNGKILAIMTGSGEIWTYLLNSTSSAAMEIFRYNMPPYFPMAASGDDIRRKRGLLVSPEYEKLRHLDPTIVKRFQSARGEFISFMSVGPHVFKDPVILAKRFLAKLSSGDGDDAVLGYYDLWKHNYNKGEVLMSLLTEEEMISHQILTRIMFNLKAEKISIRPDWSKISSAINVSEEGDMAAERISQGEIDLEDVSVMERAKHFVHTLKTSTLPYTFQNRIDIIDPLMFE